MNDVFDRPTLEIPRWISEKDLRQEKAVRTLLGKPTSLKILRKKYARFINCNNNL